MHSVTPGISARRRPPARLPIARTAARCAALAATLTAAIAPAVASARTARSAGAVHPASGHGLAAATRFYTPPPAPGAVQQIDALLTAGDYNDARLITGMETVPSAVWLDGETQAEAARGAAGARQANAEVARQIRQTLVAARFERSVPVFVAYNIPGRDCSQYSAGGAPSDAAYEAWIDAIRNALGNAQAVVILEPDALANLPGYCGSSYNASFPNITNTTRIEDVAYGVQTLESDPNISVYLDGGHSAWQAVGNIAQVLVAADVQQAQGVFFDVSNYQYATNSAFYGTWVSSCIAFATQVSAETQATALSYAPSLTAADNNPSGAFASCPN